MPHNAYSIRLCLEGLWLLKTGYLLYNRTLRVRWLIKHLKFHKIELFKPYNSFFDFELLPRPSWLQGQSFCQPWVLNWRVHCLEDHKCTFINFFVFLMRRLDKFIVEPVQNFSWISPKPKRNLVLPINIMIYMLWVIPSAVKLWKNTVGKWMFSKCWF